MKKITFIITVMLLCVVSCTTDEPILQKNPGETQPENAKTKVSESDAVRIANLFLEQISSNPTRSNQRRVSKIDVVLNDTPTRTDEPDTLLYVINFDDNQGYAIVSADTRAYPVFAMSDNGFFEINDDTNEGVKIYLENAKSTVQKMSAQNMPVFSATNSTIPTYDPSFLRSVSPLISERQAKVGDCPELNKYVVDSEGNPSHTCCVPVAVEIAMSYHKWPTELEGQKFNWEAMNAGLDDDGIARMLGILSSKGYCEVKNKIDKNGNIEYFSFINTIVPTILKCGYESDYKEFKVFNRDNDMIFEHLTNYGPLLIEARAADPQKGHVWILDGYKTTFYKPVQSEFAAYQRGVFYHCVWGNYLGGCNGYYLASDTKYFDGAPDFYDEQDPGNNFCEECWQFSYYDGAVKYFGNFRPK